MNQQGEIQTDLWINKDGYRRSNESRRTDTDGYMTQQGQIGSE